MSEVAVQPKASLVDRFLVFRQLLPRRIELGISVSASTLVLLTWELSVRQGWISGTFFPPPTLIASTMWAMVRDDALLWHAGVSILRVLAAFLLSLVLAVPIGILMSSYRVVGAALEPIVDFIRYLPVPALVPLSIIWLGATVVFLSTLAFLIYRKAQKGGVTTAADRATRAAWAAVGWGISPCSRPSPSPRSRSGRQA